MTKATAAKEKPEKRYTREESAEYLGVKVRQFAKYISQGLIKTETEKRPGKDGVIREMVVVRKSELDKIPKIKAEYEKRKRNQTKALAVIQPQTALLPLNRKQATIQQHAAIVPLDKKLWLNLEEAKLYSGLPESILLEAARTVKGLAIKHGRWLFHRVTLEKFKP